MYVAASTNILSMLHHKVILTANIIKLEEICMEILEPIFKTLAAINCFRYHS